MWYLFSKRENQNKNKRNYLLNNMLVYTSAIIMGKVIFENYNENYRKKYNGKL